MGTYMIPRNTKGEGRILYIFSTKALIYTVVGGMLGMPFYWIFKSIKLSPTKTLGTIGIIIVAVLALIGFLIGTIKVPNSEKYKVTRTVGGENIDDIILRYIKFKKKKNKICITKEED